MSEQFQQNDSLPPELPQQDVAALLKKMQQQLVFLEKKIDILVNNQSSGRTFGEKKFSKPFRSFGQHRRFDRGRDNTSGEKGFYSGRNFEKRHSAENREFGQQRKPYENSREGDFSQGRHFEKRHDAEKREFDQKKKPFSYRRKEHR